MTFLTYLVLAIVVLGWLGIFYYLWHTLLSRGAAQSRLKPGRGKAAEEAGTVFAVEVPRENEKTPLAAELLFASLHGISRVGERDHLSFEIEAQEKSIRFYIWCPTRLKSYLESQVYAQYPEASIFEVRDYLPGRFEGISLAAELKLEKPDFLPLKTFLNFDVDPLAGITAALSKLSPGERMVIQILVRPTSDLWRRKALAYIEAVRSGRSGSLTKEVAKAIFGLMRESAAQVIVGPPTESKPAGPVVLSPGTELILKAIEEKSSKLGFETKIRLIFLGQDPQVAGARLDLLVGAFKQFSTINLNGLIVGRYIREKDLVLSLLKKRSFKETGSILNTAELASLYHLPSLTVATPSIVWAGSRKGEPPADLPLISLGPKEELTVLAKTNFRGSEEIFGIKTSDRRRHIYLVGKSGVGKSTLLMNMTVSDIRAGRGVGVIDPHGEYVETILNHIPNQRVNETVVFDPSDSEFPVAFNILEVKNPKHKTVVASGVVSVFKKIFGDSWGPRLEYWLRNSILALLDYPEATLLMVPRLLTEKGFRAKVIEKIQDPVLKGYWLNEFEQLDQRQRTETISPILNKVGQFLASPLIRNIVGQPHSTIDFRRVMDEGQIFLVNLSKGTIGEDNASLLGSLIVTAFQLAALSRADRPEAERRDFYLYIDEFQNFATESFVVILSEARKYHLSLTVANQYMAQLIPEVRDAIFGNIGTLISFRVGADDAASLKREFAPVFTEEDLVNLSIYNIYVKLSINGTTTSAFSAITLPLPKDETGNRPKIIALSRERYAKPREFIEGKIKEMITADYLPPLPARRGRDQRPYPSQPAAPALPPQSLPAVPKPPLRPKEPLLKRIIERIEAARRQPVRPQPPSKESEEQVLPKEGEIEKNDSLDLKK